MTFPTAIHNIHFKTSHWEWTAEQQLILFFFLLYDGIGWHILCWAYIRIHTQHNTWKNQFPIHLPLVELLCTYSAGTCGSDKNFRMQSWLFFSSRASHNAYIYQKKNWIRKFFHLDRTSKNLIREKKCLVDFFLSKHFLMPRYGVKGTVNLNKKFA